MRRDQNSRTLEVLDPIRKVFRLKFGLAIKGRVTYELVVALVLGGYCIFGKEQPGYVHLNLRGSATS